MSAMQQSRQSLSPPLISHIELYLGRIRHGWNLPLEGGLSQFQVVEAAGGAVPDVVSYSTIGLSDFPLRSKITQKIIYQELFISVADLEGYRNIPVLLVELGHQLIQSGEALVRGQVIGPREGSVISGGIFSALYVAMPAYWPDRFASCLTESKSVVFVWLVPITSSEAGFVRLAGWDTFENELSQADLDMCSIARRELPLVRKGPQG